MSVVAPLTPIKASPVLAWSVRSRAVIAELLSASVMLPAMTSMPRSLLPTLRTPRSTLLASEMKTWLEEVKSRSPATSRFKASDAEFPIPAAPRILRSLPCTSVSVSSAVVSVSAISPVACSSMLPAPA